MTEPELPWGVGPHEEQECRLMLAGAKPMAMFCEVASHSDYFPEDEFAPHVATGRIVRREEFYRSADGSVLTRCLTFALPGEEWRMDAAHVIQEAKFTGRRKASEADDAEMGRLLGYSEREIAAFLDHTRRLRTGQP